MTRPDIAGISPFFIVQDVAEAFSFYRDRLGFEVTFQGFGDDLLRPVLWSSSVVSAELMRPTVVCEPRTPGSFSQGIQGNGEY
jgi:catechol 2,3-dioxygenase-like lactoylglutathione lyase family enzyme